MINVLGSNVFLDGAHIMDDCIIGDGCTVKQSIISNNVTLKESVQVPKGCIIAANVYLESNTILEDYSQWFSSDSVTLPFTVDSDDDDLDFKRLSIGIILIF